MLASVLVVGRKPDMHGWISHQPQALAISVYRKRHKRLQRHRDRRLYVFDVWDHVCGSRLPLADSFGQRPSERPQRNSARRDHQTAGTTRCTFRLSTPYIWPQGPHFPSTSSLQSPLRTTSSEKRTYRPRPRHAPPFLRNPLSTINSPVAPTEYICTHTNTLIPSTKLPAKHPDSNSGLGHIPSCTKVQ